MWLVGLGLCGRLGVLEQVADLVGVAARRIGAGGRWQAAAQLVVQRGQLADPRLQGAEVGVQRLGDVGARWTLGPWVSRMRST